MTGRNHVNSKKFLLINPWIADVAAYNFWIRPLGLYRLAEWLFQRGAEPLLIDCLSTAHAPGKFLRQAVPAPESLKQLGIRRRFCRYGILPEEFIKLLKAVGHIDAVLMSSAVAYWYPGVQWAVEIIRDEIPGVPVILGGVYPTLWPRHAEKYSGADHIITGPLEFSESPLASLLDLPERPIHAFKPWYELGMHDNADFSALRTAAGCPFRCTYCASRLVSGPYRPRDSAYILEELNRLYDMGVKQISFYDDALLIDFEQRLGPVLEAVAGRGMDMVFHTPNAMHAALIDQYTASLIYTAGFKTVRISLETVDKSRQHHSGGKVVCRDVEHALNSLQSAGYRADEIGVYLLAGLPGQDTSEIRAGIDFVRKLGARPFLAELSPIPGTAVWEQLRADGIVHDGIDPLLTNNSLFWEWSGFCSSEEFQELKMMCKA